MCPLAKWKKNGIIKSEILGRPLTLEKKKKLGVFIAAGTRGGQFCETRFLAAEDGRGSQVVFACVARVRPTEPSGGHVRFLFEDRLLEGASVSPSLSCLGSSETETRTRAATQRKTTNSSSHTPIWPFVNQCVGSGSRWSEMAE